MSADTPSAATPAFEPTEKLPPGPESAALNDLNEYVAIVASYWFTTMETETLWTAPASFAATWNGTDWRAARADAA